MPTPLDRASRIVSDVRSGEALTAILFASSLFVGLFAYYVLKTVREPLILATGGAEVKTYATAIQAVVLMGLVPAYGTLARRLDRRTLVLGAQLLFLLSVEGFALLAHLRLPYLGIVFYVWLGVYVLTSVAQLWALANDVYPESQGMRLFPLVALGAPLGSAAGALFASRLFTGSGAISELMHASAVLLLLQLGLLWLVFRRPEAARQAPPLDGPGGFGLVWKSEYLRWVALLVVILNLVNTTGEFLLSRAVLDEAANALSDAIARGTTIEDPRAFRESFIRGAYGDFYFVVNAASVLVQAFLASRLVRHLGMRGVLFALPLVAFATYGLASLGLPFVLFRALKITENATDYSIQNTGKALLWLPTSRDEKYKAKQVVDAYFMRFGDVLSAVLVFVAATWLALDPRVLAVANAAFSVLALFVAWRVSDGHRRVARTSA
ncbi:MAG: translocase [Sandaracinaceae bacterium]|nr:translocase [Sandaracinaceae bacterium]